MIAAPRTTGALTQGQLTTISNRARGASPVRASLSTSLQLGDSALNRAPAARRGDTFIIIRRELGHG